MSTSNIYFIDSRVQNKETLIRDIGTSAQCYVLDACVNSIIQIQRYFRQTMALIQFKLFFTGFAASSNFMTLISMATVLLKQHSCSIKFPFYGNNS